MKLTAEWDDLYARFVSAREARLIGEGLIDRPREDLRAAEEEAVAALQALKLRMDRLIAQVGAQRPTVKDSLVVGTLNPGSGPSDDIAERDGGTAEGDQKPADHDPAVKRSKA